MNDVLLVEETFRESPAHDIGVSHAILDAVASGEIADVFRIHTPARALAFGMADRIQSGYQNAVRVASAHRYYPVERLAGGRAAVFHENTLAFSWASRQEDPRAGITDRFELISNLMTTAFRALNIDAQVGEVPGEYCPGEYSVNVGGHQKVMGVGQRLVRGASHVGGVIVVRDGASIRDVLIPIYRALKIDWDPRTVGTLSNHVANINASDVRNAVVDVLGSRFDLEHTSLPTDIVERGRELAPKHVPEAG